MTKRFIVLEMSRFGCFLLIFLMISNKVNSEGFYSITAPRIIRPYSEYHVAVSSHSTNELLAINLGIISSSYSNFKTIEITPESTQIAEFILPGIKEDYYRLTAEGVLGIRFTNETFLNFEKKHLSTLVQTDKSTYKPGDIVKYRLMILDKNLKPAKVQGDVNLKIMDGKQNLIKDIKNIRINRNIYMDEIQLSKTPVLGQWIIQTNLMGENYQKKFEVAEYVLPKFEVIIDTPKNVVFKNGKIQMTIYAREKLQKTECKELGILNSEKRKNNLKEHFGKPITGEVTVSVYPEFSGSIQPFVFNLIKRKVSPINGKAFIEFDIKEELKLQEDWQRNIILEAIVEENITGNKQNTTNIVTIHKYNYNIVTVRAPNSYIPGIQFEVIIKITRYDGSIVQNETESVLGYLSSSYVNGKEVKMNEFPLGSNGIAVMKFTVDENTTNTFIIKAKYQDIELEVGELKRKIQKSGQYIQIEVLTEQPRINSDITVAIRSNQNVKNFVYQVFGRGDILLSRTVQVENEDYHIFKFPITFSMIPKLHILVYFIKNGDFISDEIIIDTGEQLWNYVKLEATKKSNPGQEVDITITTRPNSYVGIMAVDENSMKLRSGNDITYSTVFKELSQYDVIDDRYQGKQRELIILTNSITSTGKFLPYETTSTLSTLYYDRFTDPGKMTTIKKTDIGPAHKFEVNTRPPLAGPYAFSRIPKPFWNRPRVHVMQDILDTWLFFDISSGTEGRTTVHKKLPNKDTTWMLTGISLDPVTGLGLTKLPHKLQAKQVFKISTDFPNSIKLGEIISIPIVALSTWEGGDLKVEITFYNTAQEFDFVETNNEIDERPKIELYSRRSLTVTPNQSKFISFVIRPKKVGPIQIKVTASSAVVSDGFEKTLIVEPEGYPQILTEGYFFDLRTKSEQMENITLQIPKNVIPDSVSVEVSAFGDLLAATIKNINEIISLPTSCGEQTIVTFAPSVIIMKYLKNTNQLTPAIEAKAKLNLETGYQSLLDFRHSDGSFSPFGSSDKNGSIWLTAYIIRWIRQASEFIQIDEAIVISGLKFLTNTQSPDGSYTDILTPPIASQQNGISLTAFVVLAYIESSKIYPEHRNTVSKCLDYIVRNLKESDNLESIAIATYALALADYYAKANYIQILDSKSSYKDDMKWWNQTIPVAENKSPWYKNHNSIDIEMTSYAALAFLKVGLVTESLPILRWLIKQMSITGGFQTTHDTVIGLQALGMIAENLPIRDTNIQVIFSYDEQQNRININKENSIVLQSRMLPNEIRKLNISASGHGFAFAQISYKYNINVTGAWPRFTLDPQVNRISHTDYLHLSICTSFVPVPGGLNYSNMAVMEINLPTGFTVDMDTLPSLEAHERIMKVEALKRNTLIVIYFDKLDRKEICPTLDAYKTHKVAKQKPAAVIIYDYYDNARKARMFYYPLKSNLCDICEGGECKSSCSEYASKQQSEIKPDDKSKSVNLLPSIGLSGIIFIAMKYF